jgi:hypothetical protein
VAGCVSQVGQARKGGRNCANGTSGDTFYARGTKQDNRGLDLLLELEIPAGENPQNRGGGIYTETSTYAAVSGWTKLQAEKAVENLTGKEVRNSRAGRSV